MPGQGSHKLPIPPHLGIRQSWVLSIPILQGASGRLPVSRRAAAVWGPERWLPVSPSQHPTAAQDLHHALDEEGWDEVGEAEAGSVMLSIPEGAGGCMPQFPQQSWLWGVAWGC